MQPKQSSYPNQDQICWDKVEGYLKRNLQFIPQDKAMTVKAFTVGYSNITFAIQVGDWHGVLRRPPFGDIPPKAHDMEREFLVLNKIHSAFPLAPRPFILCTDKEIMDRPFYVMERKWGIIVDESLPEEYVNIPNVGRMISETVVDTLATLHSIDYKSAGLEKLGKPEGYLKRQVEGWVARYQRSRTEEVKFVKEIEEYLLANVPVQSREVSMVHNDFKLNNLMLDQKNPAKMIGVFDWELSTIGDPLTDLASSLVCWKKEGEPYFGINSVTESFGFISRREFINLYANKTGFDVINIDFYVAFAFYKYAAILQQLYFRWKKGEVADGRFADLNIGITNLMVMAHQAIQKQIL